MTFDYKGFFGEIALTHDLTSPRTARTWTLAAPPRSAEHHRYVLYLGCNVLRTSHMIQTACAVLERLGLDYVAVGGPTYCCGIVHHQQGDTAAAGGMSRHTLELFERYAPEEVIMWCPSCIYFYDEVQQMRLPWPFRHLAEFLVERLPDLRFTAEVRTRVALHHHGASEATRRQGAAGRTLLAAVPGLEVVELEPDPALGRNCSAAVQKEIGGPEVWDGRIRAEIGRARAAGAGTIATIYHGCQRLMCGFEADAPPPEGPAIEHYLCVFARGLGIAFEDTYKKYRLWADPDRILADMTPCQEANAVEMARARELVERTFVPLRSLSPGSAPS
jgi:Fe-S oxidoreductase